MPCTAKRRDSGASGHERKFNESGAGECQQHDRLLFVRGGEESVRQSVIGRKDLRFDMSIEVFVVFKRSA